MTDSIPEEPDLAKHIRNVLEDIEAGHCDDVDEAYDAIMDHPGMGVLRLKPIATMPNRRR